MWCSAVGFIVTLTLSLLAAPLAAHGQQPTKVYRIGILWLGAPAVDSSLMQTFVQSLRDQGYLLGENLVFESRDTRQGAQLNVLAAELVERNVDVIFAPGTPQARAAKQATSRIPIVFIALVDPVEIGLVASIPRPGGNLTGVTILSPEQSGKRLALLTEAVPGVSRVAVLWNPADGHNAREVRVMEAVAHHLGVQLQSLEVRGPGEFKNAFEAATREGAGALSVLATPFIVMNLRRIVDLALEHRLPTIFWMQQFTERGGMMAYGPSQQDLYRRAAVLVGKILKGAKPADLPVELPIKFELVINLKTAEALGLTIPPLLLYQATEVIR
jgi:putative tryptophan/tyrosine transport system substrate-binding protein